MDSMYEILMGLPIFQGVSHAKISELIEKIKLNFFKLISLTNETDKVAIRMATLSVSF